MGLSPGQYIRDVGGIRVEGLKHRNVLKIISSAQCPFDVVFREHDGQKQLIHLIEHCERKMKRCRDSVFELTRNRLILIMNTANELDRLRHALGGTTMGNHHSQRIQSLQFDVPSVEWMYKSSFDGEVRDILVPGYLRECEFLSQRQFPMELAALCLAMCQGHGVQEYLTEIEHLEQLEENLKTSKINFVNRAAEQIQRLRDLLR